MHMAFGLTKYSRIAFLSIFVTVCFLIILLLLKQTIPTKKKLTKQRKCKNGPKANPTFYILLYYLLIIFLVLLFNKKNNQKIEVYLKIILKSSYFFSRNFLEMLDITQNSFLGCQLSYSALVGYTGMIHFSGFTFCSRVI